MQRGEKKRSLLYSDIKTVYICLEFFESCRYFIQKTGSEIRKGIHLIRSGLFVLFTYGIEQLHI